jgi:hypothetical protein
LRGRGVPTGWKPVLLGAVAPYPLPQSLVREFNFAVGSGIKVSHPTALKSWEGLLGNGCKSDRLAI